MPQRTRATATALWVVVAIGITLGEGILHASGYRPYETIQAELSDARYGPRITSNVWFKSVSGQPIYTVRASSGSDHDKIRMVFVFGMHPRELITTEAALRLIRTLGITSCASFAGRLATSILQHATIDIIPLLNPDGRMRLERDGNHCWRGNANGVDLNRNFDWEWGGPGSTAVRGSEEYRGPSAFSESEAAGLRDLILTNNYTAVVDVHSGEQQMFSAYVGTESKSLGRNSSNHGKEQDVIRRVVRQRYIRDGGVAHVANSYTADGTLLDWASGAAAVPFVFCVESYGAIGTEDLGCLRQFNPDQRRVPRVLDRIEHALLETIRAILDIAADVAFETQEPDPSSPLAQERAAWFRAACERQAGTQ
ncbi:Peptidase M14 carboxypeptidase A domain-containing protein [Plasmodiophora brassicae]|uniref:Peptidase M14 domain-containing protein n=1 Tax=Plasmodiophora brassicae TaxID=37360 RepID=A0A0G4IGR7_PLABS|nr:hypothetical protein PBRA_000178 [Plasmodiophora brassicae]SPQ96742.1 unnamed protein product [Plasmodiophora brassicae]